MKKRIGNLEFAPATYLLPKDNWPKHPAYHINYYYPNAYYGHESEYIKEGDWYKYPNNSFCRIHKDCFKHEQSCMAIASFNYDDRNECYDIRFIGDRPLEITKEEREIFWELLNYGYRLLNKDES